MIRAPLRDDHWTLIRETVDPEARADDFREGAVTVSAYGSKALGLARALVGSHYSTATLFESGDEIDHVEIQPSTPSDRVDVELADGHSASLVVVYDDGLAVNSATVPPGASSVWLLDGGLAPGDTFCVLAFDSDNRVIGEIGVRWEHHWPWEADA